MASDLTDLLIQHTTRGLEPADQAQLESWRLRDPLAFERQEDQVRTAVAALDVYLSSCSNETSGDRMPDALRERVSAQAALVVPALADAPGPRPLVRSSGPALELVRATSTTAEPGTRPPNAPWLLAAAASLLAVLAWIPRLSPESLSTQIPAAASTAAQPVSEPTAVVPVSTDPMSPALPGFPGLTATTLDLTPSDDPLVTRASGQIMWDAETQSGTIRLSGVVANDPAEFQYQLWIFDAGRDDRYPVDGGVFDVPAGGLSVEIPIDAKLKVGQAVLFAITVEPRGGVVVSSRERIVLVAEA